MEISKSYDGLTIYTNNHVDAELVNATKKVLETEPHVNVSFSVIGRTRHVGLSHELLHELGPEYEADIDYDMYGCVVRRSTNGTR